VAESSIPLMEVSTPLPPIIPGADAKAPAKPFIMVVKTDQDIHNNSKLSPSGPNQFRLPLNHNYAYDFTINWGDGTKEVIIRKPPQSQTIPEAIAKQLEQEIHVNSDNLTFEKVIAGLSKSAQVNIILDLDKTESNKIIRYKDFTTKNTIKIMDALEEISSYFNLTLFYAKEDNAIILTSRKYIVEKLYVFHAYSKIGTYIIEITENVVGGFPAIYFINDGDCHKLISIDQWGSGSWKSMNNAFSGCYNLTIAAHDSETALTGNVTDFSNAWYKCTGLKSFPLLNTAAGTNFSKAWYRCSSLTSFPLLNTAAGTNFSGTWANCTGLKSFPMLNTSAGTDFNNAWEDCSALTSFPLLNTAAGTNFREAWESCSGLTSFPLLNTSAGINFSGAWMDCDSLTSFPLLNTAAGTDFSGAWFECYSLTSFPLLNTSAGTNFQSAWGLCRVLTSFPLLNTSAGTNFSWAWKGCSSLTSFPLLNTAAGKDFSEAWSDCSSLASFPLLNTESGTNFSNAWGRCSGLTSFPLLNTAAGTNFNSAWQQCKNLKVFPALNFGNMSDGQECFDGVTLDADSYSDLLIHLAAVNVTPKLIFDGGLSKMNEKAIAARKILTTDRGWTIYDADASKLIKKPIEKKSGKKTKEVTPPQKPQEVNDF
jgi:hypothetical protein